MKSAAPKIPTTLFVFLLFLFSCSNQFQPSGIQYNEYKITTQRPKDSSLTALMKPYRDSVDRIMNEVIGTAPADLEKKQPEGTLGNFMADAFLHMAKVKYNRPVDAAVTNFGGIRLTQLPKGSVTRGKIFELMPFDNLLILQEMKGTDLQKFLDHIAAYGGWPVAGITMQIQNKKAANVKIGGKDLNPAQTYVIATSDFVANGGDNAPLTHIPQINIGYLMRDALLDYIHIKEKQVFAQEENRVRYAQ